eukprot:XP_011429071.1 PREDICTED: uncharacterized protein LOC105329493 [Crassostrea gigas]
MSDFVSISITLFLLLVCSLPCAQSTEAQCITQGGICQTTTTLCEYPSQFVNNICSDDSSVQCCLPDKDVGCTSQGGICQENTLPCGRSYVRFLCGGGSSRRCCLPNADVRCHESGGRCYTTGSPCDGRYKTGLCGGQDRQCCIRKFYSWYWSKNGGNTCQRTPGFWYQPV